MSRAALAALLAVGLLPVLPLGAVAQGEPPTRYIAFGDSITAGMGDDPEREERGYPPRLEDLLQEAGINAQVDNHGLGAERTPEGLTRIDGVLDGGGDVLLLMEGTNDITRFIGLETTLFNLDQMAAKAEARGMEAVHATMIPRIPNARIDPENHSNQRTCERIRSLAGSLRRELVDNFEVFGSIPNVFAELYWDDPIDEVGHPNGPGYDVMAGVFADVLTGVDSVPPVTGITMPRVGETNVDPATAIQMEVWDFGAGIDLANTTLLVNGQAVGGAPQGDPTRAVLRYSPPEPLRGIVTLGLRSQDRAMPPNTVDRQVSSFLVAGTEFYPGDVDQDGRVDGADLVAFARHFGARLFDPGYEDALDFNDDGIIDGSDLAILAADFGRSSF